MTPCPGLVQATPGARLGQRARRGATLPRPRWPQFGRFLEPGADEHEDSPGRAGLQRAVARRLPEHHRPGRAAQGRNGCPHSGRMARGARLTLDTTEPPPALVLPGAVLVGCLLGGSRLEKWEHTRYSTRG